MTNAVFWKPMEAVRKNIDIKLVATDKTRNQLVSEPNYQTVKHVSENLMAIEMKKKKKNVKMNKPTYLGMAILDISKTIMYAFLYDYIQPKYQQSCTKWSCTQEEIRLCYMDTGSFVIHIKTEDFYEDIANYVEKWFDTSNYDKDDKRPLPTCKNKK